jgi:hypothetical protein
MRRAMWTTALLLAFAVVARPARAAEPPHLPLAKVVNTEKLISTQLAAMYPEEPWFLIGPARGVYLNGFGVVFSAEINLATGPSLSPFKQTITREEIARHRDKKELRLPVLRTRLYAIVGEMAAYLDTLPGNEEFVLVVTLLKYPWEEANGMPSQIVLRVPRAKLLEARRQSASLDTVVKVQEY